MAEGEVVVEGAVVVEEAVVEGVLELVVVEAFEVVDDSPPPSGRHDATTREMGIANAAGMKRRRVIQVGGCSVNQSHHTGENRSQ